MPRKKLPPGLKLDVPIIRAVSALRSSLDKNFLEDPQCPDPILELDDALEKFEEVWYDEKPKYFFKRVLFHEIDLI